MAIVTRDELKEMVGRMRPSLAPKPVTRDDSTKTLEVRESLRALAARQLKELGK